MVMNLEINTAVPHGELAKSLADKLRFYIADTPVPVGGRLPSNREIARCANVSQVTARMAVRFSWTIRFTVSMAACILL